jgi:hypothetical protein
MSLLSIPVLWYWHCSNVHICHTCIHIYSTCTAQVINTPSSSLCSPTIYYVLCTVVNRMCYCKVLQYQVQLYCTIAGPTVSFEHRSSTIDMVSTFQLDTNRELRSNRTYIAHHPNVVILQSTHIRALISLYSALLLNRTESQAYYTKYWSSRWRRNTRFRRNNCPTQREPSNHQLLSKYKAEELG